MQAIELFTTGKTKVT